SLSFLPRSTLHQPSPQPPHLPFSLQLSPAPPDLHSFPTRRSSDLHGWGLNRESLRGIAILFQHTHRVHLIDLPGFGEAAAPPARSEEHTSELQSLTNLVCRLLLEKKKKIHTHTSHTLNTHSDTR